MKQRSNEISVMERDTKYHLINDIDDDDDATDEENGTNESAGARLSLYNSKNMNELLASKKRLNMKKIALGVVSLLIIVVVIVAVVLVTTTGDASADGQHSGREGISLQDFIEYKTSALDKFNGSWNGNDEILYHDYENVYIYDVMKKEKRSLIGHELGLYPITVNPVMSADGKYILVAKDIRQVFRNTILALYYIINLSTLESHQLTVNEDLETFISTVKWSPVGNSLVFVFQNNIYYKKSPKDTPIALTDDGTPSVFNGIPDWVYEEEVLSSDSALWFSPDGTKIAFIRFNDTTTPVITLNEYGPPGDVHFQYTHGLHIHYPKVGSPNPEVSLFRVNLDEIEPNKAVEKLEIYVPVELENKEHIIALADWADNDVVVSIWMNRVQNVAYVQSCAYGTCFPKNIEIKSTTGWVDLFATPLFGKDGTQMAVITSHDQGAAGGFRHLTLITLATGRIEAITKGEFVVKKLLHWDNATNLIFYTANLPENAGASHVYAVKAIANSAPICVTCDITSDNIAQTYFNAEFNPKKNYVVIETQGPGVPHVDLYSWQLSGNSLTKKHIMQWTANKRLRGLLDQKAIALPMHQNIKLDSGFDARVVLYLPPNVDLSGKIKYPMLVFVYAGPDTVAVTDKWSFEYGNSVASNKSVIYAKIDGRGSGLRGDMLMHQIYKRFGTVEVDDQIEVTRKLRDTLPYIDPARIAIWGWSYGGYASAMALAKDKVGVFKCAASVAPVTDWTYYDSIYTERYMGLYRENPLGYTASRLSTMGASFAGKKYFLIHGTLDDNVHYQQSMALARSLEKNDVLFKQMTYPDENHSLNGVTPHLYHSLDRFFGDCFGLERDV